MIELSPLHNSLASLGRARRCSRGMRRKQPLPVVLVGCSRSTETLPLSAEVKQIRDIMG